ncbi:MAG: hypothetical protein ACRDOM_02570 [Nocardioides sp.]
MRRVVVTLIALALAGAVAFVWQANASDEHCSTTLEYDGVTYAVHHVTEEIGEEELGVGTERGCGHKGHWSGEVAVSRVAGVDPRTALATPVAAKVLYVAEGVAVDELPSDIAELVTPQP